MATICKNCAQEVDPKVGCSECRDRRSPPMKSSSTDPHTHLTGMDIIRRIQSNIRRAALGFSFDRKKVEATYIALSEENGFAHPMKSVAPKVPIVGRGCRSCDELLVLNKPEHEGYCVTCLISAAPDLNVEVNTNCNQCGGSFGTAVDAGRTLCARCSFEDSAL